MKRNGFTLTELLVVMTLFALLMALGAGAVQGLIKGNDVTRCQFQLQKIGNALKMYHVDYAGVPPVYIDPATMAPIGANALNALWNNNRETEYLRDWKRVLSCPADNAVYADVDEKAQALNPLNQYKYMPCRTLTVGHPTVKHPAFRRQLSPWLEYNEGGMLVPATKTLPGRTWYPDDDTIVTWCDRHTDHLVGGRRGMYLVLFWDSSVRALSAGLFDGSDSGAPIEAWENK